MITKPKFTLYALRDRMLNYFMQPFVASDQFAILASLADTINGDHQHAITQAPHHFELWRLAQISETGDVEADKDFVCDCSSLVREDFRETREHRGNTRPPAPGGRTGAPEVLGGTTRTPDRAPASAAPATPLQPAHPNPGPPGIPGHSDR